MRSCGRPVCLGQRRRAERALDHGVDACTSRASRGSASSRVLVHHLGEQLLVERCPSSRRCGPACRASIATSMMVRKLSSRRFAPTLPGLIRYLASAAAQSGYLREEQVPVVVEVADDRATCHLAPHDLGHGPGGLVVVDRDAHQLAAGLGQGTHLVHGRRDVGRVGVGHRLDDDRVGRPTITPPTATVTVLRRCMAEGESNTTARSGPLALRTSGG